MLDEKQLVETKLANLQSVVATLRGEVASEKQNVQAQIELTKAAEQQLL